MILTQLELCQVRNLAEAKLTPSSGVNLIFGANASGKIYVSGVLSNPNAWIVSATNPSTVITIQVTDASARCPQDYQLSMTQATNPRAFWDGASTYTKLMAP